MAVLLKIVTSKGLVDADQLRRLVEAIDIADGTADGKYEGSPLS